jgi:formylglycine-generating enzyme required for sulfatase activity
MPWYVRSQNKIFGPLSDDDLRRLALEKRLTAAHSVGKSAHGPWVKADRVKGLGVQPSNPSKTATADGSIPATPLRTDAVLVETVQDRKRGLWRLDLILIGTLLTVLLSVAVVTARALVSIPPDARAVVVTPKQADSEPEPSIPNNLRPFNIVTRTETTSRLEKMHPVEAEGKFPHDRRGTDDFLHHKQVVIEEKEVTECVEKTFDLPSNLSDYGDNLRFVHELSHSLKSAALTVTSLSETTILRGYVRTFTKLAFLVSDLPENERAAIHRFARPASLRFGEGVSAAISLNETARDRAEDLEQLVEAVKAIAAEPGAHVEEWLRTPPREAVTNLDTVRNTVGMEFRLIPSGTFLMGTADQSGGTEPLNSGETEPQSDIRTDAREDEKPAHEVMLTKAFYMGVMEVSHSQFERVVHGSSDGSSSEGYRPWATNKPKEIEVFLARLSDMPEEKAAGRMYRLPTEAEWEYACRAGTSTLFSFGDDAKWLVLYERFADRPARCNAWGLYDMHDVGDELVSDRYGPYTELPQTDPCGDSFGSQRVARGGRSAARRAIKLDKEKYFSTYVRLRVVFDAPSPGARRASDVQSLVADGKLEEADRAFRDCLDLGAARPSIRASALALAQGWLTRVDTAIAAGGTSAEWANDGVLDDMMAGCNAVKAACTSACDYGCPESRVHSLLAHQLLLQAIILDREGERDAAIARLLESLATDAALANQLVDFSAPRPKQPVAAKQQPQETERPEKLERPVPLRPYETKDAVSLPVEDLGFADDTRVSKSRMVDGSLLFKPTSDHPSGDLIASAKSRLDARLWQATLDSWRRRLDAALSANDATAAFQLIGDGMWLDAEFITSLPPVRNSIGVEFKLIPAGEFTMGDPYGEKDESPHKVVLSRAFFIGTHELKNSEFQRLTRESGRSASGAIEQKRLRHKPIDLRQRSRRSEAGDDECPVDELDWLTAESLCGDLSNLAAESAGGRHYRLPTEAEWEYACRAGSTTRWSFGNDERLFHDYGWRDGKEKGSLHAVGSKKPNAWGLFDMHGNASEWVADWYGDYHTGNQLDPRGPDRDRRDGSAKVFRGGNCFAENAGLCRSARRGSSSNGSRGQGVRIALTPASSRPVVVGATERLAHKVSIALAETSFDQAIQLLSDEIGLPIIVDASVCNEPSNMRTRISADKQSILAEDLLSAILNAANKKNQLEYLVRLENGYQTLVIYSR